MTAKQHLGAGAALEKVIRNDLPEHVELDPREEALLRAAAAQADDIAVLEADIRDRGHIVDGGLVNPSTIRCTVLLLRAIVRRAVNRGELAVNPCDGLELAAVRGRRDRFADPTEAEALIAAAPERDHALGDGLVCRTSQRRVASLACPRCRSRLWGDPCGARLG